MGGYYVDGIVGTPVDVFLTGGFGCSRGSGYVWNAEDSFRIRKEFRLLGDFVGTLPKHCSQNQFLALPLVLSYDELLFGVERGFLRLLADSPQTDYTARLPSEAEKASHAFYAARDADCNRQAEISCAAQEAERQRYRAKAVSHQHGLKRPRVNASGVEDATDQARLSRLEMLKKRKRSHQADLDVSEEIEEPPYKTRKVYSRNIFARIATAVLCSLHRVLPNIIPDPLAVQKKELKLERDAMAARKTSDYEKAAALRERAFMQARSSATIVTPTEARPGERRRSTLVLDVPKPIGISDRQLALRQTVFRDLHAKGYYMSCGAKFGADFLAYAGEPLLYHASLAVIVMNENDEVTAHDVIALGRLGDATKKRTVLAYVQNTPDDNCRVKYVGIQWEETLP